MVGVGKSIGTFEPCNYNNNDFLWVILWESCKYCIVCGQDIVTVVITSFLSMNQGAKFNDNLTYIHTYVHMYIPELKM